MKGLFFILSIFTTTLGLAQVQTRIQYFDKIPVRKTLLLDKVKDQVVAIVERQDKGLQWQVYDKELQIQSDRHVNIPYHAGAFKQQLIRSGDKFVLLSQIRRNNDLEVRAGVFDMKGEQLITDTLLYNESNRSVLLPFDILSSPNSKAFALTRALYTGVKDRIMLTYLVFDNTVDLKHQQDVMMNIDTTMRSIYTMALDNNEDLWVVIGDRFDNYRLGTEFEFVNYKDGKFASHIVKLRRQKLKNVVFDLSAADSISIYGAYNDKNSNKNLNGFTRVRVNKKDFNSTERYITFSEQDQKNVSRITGGPWKTVMNKLFYENEYAVNNNIAVAAIVEPIVDDIVVSPLKPTLPKVQQNPLNSSDAALAYQQLNQNAYNKGSIPPMSSPQGSSNAFPSARELNQSILVFREKDRDQFELVNTGYKKPLFSTGYPRSIVRAGDQLHVMETLQFPDVFSLSLVSLNGKTKPVKLQDGKGLIIQPTVAPVPVGDATVIPILNYFEKRMGLLLIR